MEVTVPINYAAVLVAAVASTALGFLWYGPLFGRPWMKLMGFTPESMQQAKQKGMAKNYTFMMLGTLVMAYVLAHALVFASTYMKVTGVSAGIMTGFWNWLGFVAPIQMGEQLWGGKPWKLFAVNGGYQLVALLLMGIILALW